MVGVRIQNAHQFRVAVVRAEVLERTIDELAPGRRSGRRWEDRDRVALDSMELGFLLRDIAKYQRALWAGAADVR